MKDNYSLTKLACYTSNVSMSITAMISPLLLITFRELYGISYSLLGLLVLLNFFPQLIIDLVFSFFSHKFNIEKAVKISPVLTFTGLWVYALLPTLFPKFAFLGLVLGTVIFSVSGGLVEVLLSPVVAAIPSDNPDREISKLHSAFAWGTVGVIVFASLYLLIFDKSSWMYLVLLLSLVPISSALMFTRSKIPEMKTPEKFSGALGYLRRPAVWLCVGAIFLGGAAECTMSQWASGYLEMSLGVPKVWGDVLGVALFGLMLGLGRTIYAKIGKNIERVLLFGSIGSALCYLIAATTPVPAAGIAACALNGFCVSMLWPGSLLISSDRIGDTGVFAYAIMAAGGDLGASIGPQLVGLVTDAVIASESAVSFAARFGITAERFGMKVGMLFGMIFPLVAIPLCFYIYKSKNAKGKNQT